MTGQDSATLATWITNWLRAELKGAQGEIAVGDAFTRFGMDSVHAMMMVGDLEEYLDRRLSPTLAWDYPTVSSLASFLAAPAAADAELASIDSMSEAELDSMLERERRETP